MTPPDFERNKADHTAFAVRVAPTATLYSELFETTTAKQKGEPPALLFAF
jgi:hypothetical protein